MEGGSGRVEDAPDFAVGDEADFARRLVCEHDLLA